ncbi:MAG: helix-turn-helix domain-containing protein [Coriobacteriaceae bacterium]|nr:helix-turn-helix domain-containing protein [Coriobacteriaceae bacterium]
MTVSQAAEMLGISAARVRRMLQDGVLDGQKEGGVWMIDRSSVVLRLQNGARVGRPPLNANDDPEEQAQLRRGVRAHELYEACREVLAGAYDASVLAAAETEEERRFYLMVSDFFLQQKQRELVAQGVW